MDKKRREKEIQAHGLEAYTDYGNYFVLDQIQNYWLKAFPVTHRHIAKNFNAIKEEQEKAPDWLTTEIRGLLEKYPTVFFYANT